MEKKLTYPTHHDEFMMWLGFCITGWAKVEEQLFAICQRCLGARQDRVAIIYCRTPTLDARMNLIDELLRTMLPVTKPGDQDHPDLAAWNALRKDTKALLPFRNRLAHHPVRARSGHEGERLWFLAPTAWLEIYVSEAERLRTGSVDAKPLKTDDLTDHVHAVQKITRRFASFVRGVLPKHAQ
jgi:hypothetical protein